MFLELFNRTPAESKMELLDVFANSRFRAMVALYKEDVIAERGAIEPATLDDKEFIKHCIVLKERLLVLEELEDFLKAGQKLLINHNT